VSEHRLGRELEFNGTAETLAGGMCRLQLMHSISSEFLYDQNWRTISLSDQ
jgi:hypothetical protein